jgi:hypothetical protein
MSNLSDKDIDRFSREAADLYEPDPTSLSWSRLEQKLIQQIPERPPDGFRFGRINPFIWGSTVILVAGLSIFTIKNFKYYQYSTRVSQKVVKVITASDKNQSKSNSSANRVDSIASVNVSDMANRKKTDLTIERGNVSVQKTFSSADVTHKSNTKGTVGGFLNSHEQDQIAKSGKKKSRLNEKNMASVTDAAFTTGYSSGNGNDITAATSSATNDNGLKDTSSFNNIFPEFESNQTGSPRKVAGKYALPLVVTVAAPPGTIRGNDSLLQYLHHNKIAVPYKSLRINRSLNFGISFGPDYTDAGGITNNQLGNNIGLTFGYYITNKFSLNTGLFYSNKFFWAPGQKTGNSNNSNLQPWTAAAQPPIDYINGATNIWEVPLTLRYDFAQSEKTKFFLNAGLSSYFIMKQTYIKFFYNGQRLLAFKTFDDNQENYWFKVADISFGFETDMGKGFSFQAEPFFKLPFTSMGIENLKLNSYGFLLSFRYSPVLSRIKK